jgi:hypothetical protein
MLKKILVGLVALVFAFVVVVALQPADYRVVRNATISGPTSGPFAHVNDFHKWEAWSPWAKIDPTMKQTYEGPSSGAGAIYTWSGNSEVGEGRMTLLESRPGELVKIKLDFIKPFASTADTEFSFKPEGGQTVVTWSMSGEKNFMSKAFCMFVSMDKMVGGDFEQGLAQLKSVVEATAKK